MDNGRQLSNTMMLNGIQILLNSCHYVSLLIISYLGWCKINGSEIIPILSYKLTNLTKLNLCTCY
jgi:hypothetical protein